MGEKRSEVRGLGQFVAQLVARKTDIDQKKCSAEPGLGDFVRRRDRRHWPKGFPILSCLTHGPLRRNRCIYGRSEAVFRSFALWYNPLLSLRSSRSRHDGRPTDLAAPQEALYRDGRLPDEPARQRAGRGQAAERRIRADRRPQPGRRDPLQHLLGPPACRRQDLQRPGPDQAAQGDEARADDRRARLHGTEGSGGDLPAGAARRHRRRPRPARQGARDAWPRPAITSRLSSP